MTEPEFSPLGWQHKAWLDGLFRQQPPQLSAYTFTNLYTWRHHYRFEIASWEQLALLRVPREGGFDYFCPWGPGDLQAAVHGLLGQGGKVVRIPENLKAGLETDARLMFAFDRDNSDYLYRTSDLRQLPGRHYDGKRNLIRKFKAAFPEYAYLPLNPENALDCLAVEEAWCVEKDCDNVPALDHERLAIREMLERFGDLPLLGGAILVRGRCCALALGEALTPDTLVVHILKAMTGMPGLYQVMMNEFVVRA